MKLNRKYLAVALQINFPLYFKWSLGMRVHKSAKNVREI